MTKAVLVPGDAALVDRARTGDRAAFVQLLDRHYPRLLGLCRRVAPAMAEDAAQEAVLLAMLHLDRLREPERFGAWLAGIGLNTCRLWLREQARWLHSREAGADGHLGREWADDGPDPADLAAAADVSARVRGAIGALPSGQRAAVLLHYLAGLSQAEAAAVLGIDEGAVKARLHKARRTLRRPLTALWRDEPTPAREQEETMESQLVEVTIESVRRNNKTGQRVAVLEEKGGERLLPIWIGNHEADSLVVHMEQLELPRPGSHDLALSLVRAARAEVREVVIERLADDIFYASVLVEGPAGRDMVDARPSDALALAIRAGAPIKVRPELFALESHTRASAAASDAENAEERAAAQAELARIRGLLTPGAARTLARAREEVPRRFSVRWIGLEHVLLAMLDEGTGVGAAALREAGVAAEGIASRIVRSRREPPTEPASETYFVDRMLTLAAEEAARLGHQRVGTGHLLHGLLAVREGHAFTILQFMKVDPADLAERATRALSAADGPPAEE